MKPTDQVDLFLKKVDALLDKPLMQGHFSPGFEIKAELYQQARFEIRQPPPDQLESFLGIFRQFILSDEPVFVSRIFNLCYQACSEGALRRIMGECYKKWKRAKREGELNYVVDGKQMTPDYLLDLWLNGHYFHSDERKMAALERLRLTGLPFDKQIFLESVWDTTQYVVFLRNQIRAARAEGLLSL